MNLGATHIAFSEITCKIDSDFDSFDPSNKYISGYNYHAFTFQMMDMITIARQIYKAGDEIKILEITELHVTDNIRNEGVGSNSLQKLINNYPDYLIIVKAIASPREYKAKPSPTEYEKLFNKLEKFYNKNGFFDATFIFNTYSGDTVRTYMYNNEVAKKYVEYMEKINAELTVIKEKQNDHLYKELQRFK